MKKKKIVLLTTVFFPILFVYLFSGIKTSFDKIPPLADGELIIEVKVDPIKTYFIGDDFEINQEIINTNEIIITVRNGGTEFTTNVSNEIDADDLVTLFMTNKIWSDFEADESYMGK